MVSAPLARDAVFALLQAVKDPEIPAVSVVELGIVRDVRVTGSAVQVSITPTYSGCPAMREIEDDIRAALLAAGAATVTIEMVYSPAWTTDWIDATAREKLREAGIAPPGRTENGGLLTLTHRRIATRCPYCNSTNTRLVSEFGSTACKAIHQCSACQQPFDEFKAF